MARAAKFSNEDAIINLEESKVKESLVRQLEHNGADVEHFMRLVDDYVFYDAQEKKCQEDIRERGTVVEAISSQGHLQNKANENIKSMIDFNKQKLNILKQLGLTIMNVGSEQDEEL